MCSFQKGISVNSFATLLPFNLLGNNFIGKDRYHSSVFPVYYSSMSGFVKLYMQVESNHGSQNYRRTKVVTVIQHTASFVATTK